MDNSIEKRIAQKDVKKSLTRLMALDSARVTTRLLEEDYFEDAFEAVKAGDKEAFVEICGKAGIPEAVANQLWECFVELLSSVGFAWA